jgi:hypothetical protein
MMRDLGFDYYWQDAYATNIYALGFEWRPEMSPAAAVTAVEVFEHVPDPTAFVKQIVDSTGTDTILFTQELHHGVDPDWEYLAPECGQHISFYSSRTLAELAERTGMRAMSAGYFHMLTRRDIGVRRFQLEVRASHLTFPLVRRAAVPLTMADRARAAARLGGS